MCNAWNHSADCNCGWGGDGQIGGFGGYGGGHGYSTFRSTSAGLVFEFPFITYPSYVNPNARCPVCGDPVYFYQSPYGGRVFFNELGPPWEKHGCTDNPAIRQHFATAESRSRFLVGSSYVSTTSRTEGGLAAVEHKTTDGSACPESLPRHLPAWSQAGWMPFIVTRIVPCPYGIEAEGKLFESPGGSPLEFWVKQSSRYADFRKTKDGLSIGFSLVQNANQIVSALNECPILLKKDPDLGTLLLSSFALSANGAVEEITMSIFGEILNREAAV